MKRLGIIGGIGPESTIVYYRSILMAGRKRLDGLSAYRCKQHRRSQGPSAGRRGPCPRLAGLSTHGDRCRRACWASLALIAANTPHLVFDEIRERSPIELVSIVEATRDAARDRGFTRLALFGTKFTMQGRSYPDVSSRSRIELVTPREDEQEYIHAIYVDELLNSVFHPGTRHRLLAIVDLMKRRDGVQAVILAGTELPLLLTTETPAPLPLLDTTEIHVMAAINQLLG